MRSPAEPIHRDRAEPDAETPHGPALDDLDPADLAEAPVRYMDGRYDNWMERPAETRHL